jgi:hypothetical protein
VLRVDEGGEPACLLGLGDDVQAEGRLAAGLRAEDLDDAAAGDPTDAEGQVEGIEATFWGSSSPMRMIEPFPNCRSICETAASMALLLSNASSKKRPCWLVD